MLRNRFSNHGLHFVHVNKSFILQSIILKKNKAQVIEREHPANNPRGDICFPVMNTPISWFHKSICLCSCIKNIYFKRRLYLHFIKYYTKYIPKYCERMSFIKPASEVHSPYASIPNTENILIPHNQKINNTKMGRFCLFVCF